MNARRPRSKRSRIERKMDILILGMFALLFVMCIIGASCFAVWTRKLSPKMWYLAPEPGRVAAAYNPQKPVVVWLLSFVTSFVLYGYLIHISLYVSLEMVKVAQSRIFINMDRAMYHRESDTPAKVRLHVCLLRQWMGTSDIGRAPAVLQKLECNQAMSHMPAGTPLQRLKRMVKFRL